ncbi:MAG TPA: LacI family DNA-binding transcriptional regulator [Jatrophihabitans sp.]|nr:LacI family DNA-binding transcriptional regulator [Jatrophihabitans sp.]
MPVSLKDVASVAGVSIKTVSNVVNEYPFVRAETRARVQAVIEQLGYRPNLSARRLRSGRTGLITLSLPELTPYFAELAEHIAVVAEAAGLTVLIDRTGGERDHERLSASGIRRDLSDGTIASPMSMTPADLERLRPGHPIVLLGERLSYVGVDHVAVDSIAAARTATGHLIERGRRAVAAVGTARRPAGTIAQRQRGYREALRDAGLPVERSLMGDAELLHREDGYRAMQALLQQRPDLDAAFCFNDLLAFGALRALDEAGRRVPDDVAVVGFDDVEECRFSTPPLSSIAPDKRELASTAVQLLQQRIAGLGPTEPQEVFPPFRLRVRASSGG